MLPPARGMMFMLKLRFCKALSAVVGVRSRHGSAIQARRAFDWDVNLCQVGHLNGPLEVALKIWDHEGNVVNLLSRRTIQVDHACPPPVSQMTTPTTYDGTAFKLIGQQQNQAQAFPHSDSVAGRNRCLVDEPANLSCSSKNGMVC